VPFASWLDLYRSEWQGVVAVVVVPALFLLYLAASEPPRHGGVLPAAARFVRWWAAVFAVLTILDPVVGGPLLRLLGVADAPVATAVMVAFVLLGDFRVYLLVFGLLAYAGPRRSARAADPLHAARDTLRVVPPRAALAAALATLVVPIVAGLVDAFLRSRDPALPSQTIWLIYELAFLTVAVAMLVELVPSRVPAAEPRLANYLRRVLAYVAAYYALWATADVLILAGIDAGWALRVVPNQLYYALWVPFAYWLFFARR
jgi:hypothetical protein